MSNETRKSRPMPTSARLRYLLIRQSLIAQDTAFADVASQLGVSRAMVSLVARGHRKSRRVRRALARAAGLPYKQLWGDDK